MRNKWLLLLAAASALPAGAVTASLPNWPGIQVQFNAKLEPPPGPGTHPAVLRQLEKDVVGGVIVNGGVHRIWRDAEQKVYIGYDLAIESASSPGVLRVRIAPLSLTARQMAEHGIPETWTRISLPTYPVVPEVHVGDTLAIDLMANPRTGQKLVDYLTVQPAAPPAAAGARDFTLADAGLTLNQPRISLNGKLAESTAQTTAGISGPAVWFYLQGQGRFILTLAGKPGAGFVRAGEVSDGVLTFQVGADAFRIECDGQIAPGPGRYNIYVLVDRAWRPAGQYAGEPVVLGAASLETLVRNR